MPASLICQEPGKVLAMDGFSWTHPLGQRTCRGIILVDEGSRHFIIKILEYGRTEQDLGNSTAEEAINVVINEWLPHYGKPALIRVDADGCYRNNLFTQAVEGLGVRVDQIAGEAHWKMAWPNG